MHPYSLDSKSRIRVYFFLLLLSCLLSYLLLSILPQLPWWIESPSPLALYGALFLVLDRSLWHQSFLQPIFKTPDLRGTWQGVIQTSHRANSKKKIPVSVTIKQNWTTVLVELETAQSKSLSTVAALSGAMLLYQYNNFPSTNAPKTMEAHEGSAEAKLKGKDLIEINYYTGRGRSTHGQIKAKKVEKVT